MHNFKNTAILHMFVQLCTLSFSLDFAFGKSSEVSERSSSPWNFPHFTTSNFKTIAPETSSRTLSDISTEGSVARRNVLTQSHATKTKCGRHAKSRHCRAYRRRQRLNRLHRSSLLQVANITGIVSETTSAIKLNTGEATYYGTGLGACGITSTDASMIAAASHIMFDNFPGATANPNLNPICGRKVNATYEGASVVVEIVDRCVGCAEFDLDFSPSAFALIGPMAKGRLSGMTWYWV